MIAANFFRDQPKENTKKFKVSVGSVFVTPKNVLVNMDIMMMDSYYSWELTVWTSKIDGIELTRNIV